MNRHIGKAARASTLDRAKSFIRRPPPKIFATPINHLPMAQPIHRPLYALISQNRRPQCLHELHRCHQLAREYHALLDSSAHPHLPRSRVPPALTCQQVRHASQDMVDTGDRSMPSISTQNKLQQWPKDLGLVDGTFIRPTGDKLPSILKEPTRRAKMEWHWLKTRFWENVG